MGRDTNDSLARKNVMHRALELAFANGWDWELYPKADWQQLDIKTQARGIHELLKDDAYKTVIYNHDFAKALWGDNTEYIQTWNENAKKFINVPPLDPGNYKPAWQYHLQQLVIASDPFGYLADNI